jgi:hypothetical protein
VPPPSPPPPAAAAAGLLNLPRRWVSVLL